MKYKDLNNSNYIKNNGKQSASRSKFLKAGIWIVCITVIFFGLKLLITPVVEAVANLLQDTTTSISFLTNQRELKQQNGVTNVLIIGIDARYIGGTTLTDTIIIGSFRHSDEKTTLLSLPRDLWVRVDEFGEVATHYTKVNGVFSLGEQYGYPGGGIELLKKVLYDHVGLPINYYAQINFDGFENLIDTLNGVDIYVEQDFIDYQYPIEGHENASWYERWEVVSFEQGWQHMSGETALKYARSRHAYGPEGSDFARSKRQQKVILAMKEKILSSSTLFNPAKLRELYLTFTDEINTDIEVIDIPTFYEYSQKVEDFSNIETIVLTNDDTQEGLLYVPDANDYGGAFILLPRNGWQEVKDFVAGKIAMPEFGGEHIDADGIKINPESQIPGTDASKL